MSMSEWARREVELAIEHEKGVSSDDDPLFLHVQKCYQAALEAYEFIADQGHSGMSFAITKGILDRLMNELPLTPIEDTPDIWEEVYKVTFQCKRLGSLFKNVDHDGAVTYRDINRVVCVETTDEVSFYSKFVSDEINKIFPITMPYYPSGTFTAYVHEDDTHHVFVIKSVKVPDGDTLVLNWFYKETDDGYVRITSKEMEELTNEDKKM